MDIKPIALQMAVLFLLIIAGYAANKAKVMDSEGNKKISGLIVNIAMPAMILSSVMGEERALSSSQVWTLIGIAAGVYAFYIIVSLFLPKLLGVAKKDVNLYRFMIIFSNVGFMGFAVVQALFGAEAVFYASIFNIPFNLLVYSLGIALIEGEKGRFSLKNLLNPGIIACILSVIIYLANIPVPQIIARPLELLGQMTTPAAMLIIGSSLAAIPLGEVFRDVRIYVLSLFKLILLPVLLWAVLRLLIQDQVILGVCVVIAAMPVATNCTMLCAEYGGDEQTAAKGVFISTLLSVITIPALMGILFA